jgi:hypothetical protein
MTRLTDISKTTRGKSGLGFGGGGAHDELRGRIACARAQGTTCAGHCAAIHTLGRTHSALQPLGGKIGKAYIMLWLYF